MKSLLSLCHLIFNFASNRHNGGSPIIGYVVETLETGSEDWQVACTQDTVKETYCSVPELKVNTEYKLRVTAVNKAGSSDSAQIKNSVIVKVHTGTIPFSISHHLNLLYLLR